MELTITLSSEQEAAVTQEHGSLDFLSEYVGNYANYLIAKQAETARAEKIRLFSLLSEEEKDIVLAPIITEIAVQAAQVEPQEGR